MKRLLFILLLLPILAQATETTVSDGGVEVAGGRGTGGSGTAFGISATIEIWGAQTYYVVIRPVGLTDSLGTGQTISAGALFIWSSNSFATGTLHAYQCLKPWIEGIGDNSGLGLNDEGTNSAQWDNDGPGGQQFGWNTFGANCANDDGTENTTDGDGSTCTTASERDRFATSNGSVSVDATDDGVWIEITLTAALLQKWYDDGFAYGLVLHGETACDFEMSTDDHATAAQRPYFAITHSGAGAGADISHVRRVKENRR